MEHGEVRREDLLDVLGQLVEEQQGDLGCSDQRPEENRPLKTRKRYPYLAELSLRALLALEQPGQQVTPLVERQRQARDDADQGGDGRPDFPADRAP